MHRGDTHASPQPSQPSSSSPSSSAAASSAQHGIACPCCPAPAPAPLDAPVVDAPVVDVKSVDEALRRLSGLALTGNSTTTTTTTTTTQTPSPASPATSTLSPATRGQRIAEYERAMQSGSGSGLYRREKRSPVVLQVVPRTTGASFAGPSLDDLPNEILTHVFSYLPPGAHGSVALVSKRFCALVTTPHAWRLAFLRHFGGNATISGSDELARTELRPFARLTVHASWRSEYLQRTGLLKSLQLGRPGASSIGVRGENGIGGAGKKGSASKNPLKKATAVITYTTPLLGPVTHMQAAFAANNKKTPIVVHGSALYGVATCSNPVLGRPEGWGYFETYTAPQFHDVDASLAPYGLGGRGRVGMPNVMDTSPLYGVIVGEAWPGGRAFTRTPADRELAVLDTAPRFRFVTPAPDMPMLPEHHEGVTAVWAAKTAAVPTVTQAMVGFLVGTSLGVVSAYSLDKHFSGARYPWTHVTARWVLSPGVPIVALAADDHYSEKRRAARRVWAVALNALGEVFYLQDVPPAPPASVTMPADPAAVRLRYEREVRAYQAGRSVGWSLVEATRRRPPGAYDDKVPALRLAASPAPPRLSPDAAGLDLAQRTAEARAMEQFAELLPWHFCSVYDAWDMRRKLEVDFGGGSSENATAEHIVVISCGIAEDRHRRRTPQPAAVVRYTRLLARAEDFSRSPPATIGWQTTVFSLTDKKKNNTAAPRSTAKMEITCSAIDRSHCAVLAPLDDPLVQTQQQQQQQQQQQKEQQEEEKEKEAAAATGSVWTEVPGRRARWLAVGTQGGHVIVWNMREPVPVPRSLDADADVDADTTATADATATRPVWPLRIIRTSSPAVSALAVSSLYLVHGGSDGLVQAWDPLASTTDALRTLHAPSAGRVPRHLKHLIEPDGVAAGGAGMLRSLSAASFAPVGAIVLDADATELRGVLAVGTQLRYWSYGGGSLHAGASRKRGRRLRHVADGQLAHRSAAEKMADYIAAETADLRDERARDERHRERLLARFGVGLAGLTDDEVLQYAEMVSQREYLEAQQQLLALSSSSGSSQEEGSAGGDEAAAARYDSSSSSPPLHSETSVVGQAGPSCSAAPVDIDNADDDDFELQIQRAMRLSLMEGVNDDEEDAVQHDPFASPGKGKGKEKEKEPENKPPPAVTAPPDIGILPEHYMVGENEDDDLQLALQLSMRQEEEAAAAHVALKSSYDYAFEFADDDRDDNGADGAAFVTREEQMANDAALAALLQQDDFPALEPTYVGKGKGKR